MEDLKSLIQNEAHEKILELPGHEYDRYKAIASIYLERYKEALQYAPKNSFEMAYSYYKLRDFKKALKILRKLSGKEVDILKSQCLYFLGYYSEAYAALSKYGNSDEFAVNLSAINALWLLNKNSRIKPSLFTSGDQGEIAEEQKFSFSDPECLVEGEYNATFKLAENEKEWVEMLMSLQNKYKLDGSCIDKQLKNLMNEDLPKLLGRETDISQFNTGIKTTIPNPVLFQPNFIENGPNNVSDFQIFRDYQLNSKEYLAGMRTFQPFNDKLRLLKSFIVSKRKPTAKRAASVIKTLKNVESTLEKDILMLLAAELPDDQFQKQALELILKASQEK